MSYEGNPLPYEYTALEPTIDEATMHLHFDKHYQGYIKKYNAAVSGTAFDDMDVNEVLADLSALPDDIRTAVRNNGGGVSNHTLFWSIMSPNGGGSPSGELASAIEEVFGSFEEFQEAFTKAALGQFGSGWAWLVVDGDSLKVMSTPNQDTPISQGLTPILGLDVWEHSYYLHYNNRRGDYVAAFWNVVNWEKVSELFEAAK